MLQWYWICIHRTVLGTARLARPRWAIWTARIVDVPPLYARRIPRTLQGSTPDAYPPRHRQQRDAVGRSLEGERRWQ